MGTRIPMLEWEGMGIKSIPAGLCWTSVYGSVCSCWCRLDGWHWKSSIVCRINCRIFENVKRSRALSCHRGKYTRFPDISYPNLFVRRRFVLQNYLNVPNLDTNAIALTQNSNINLTVATILADAAVTSPSPKWPKMCRVEC